MRKNILQVLLIACVVVMTASVSSFASVMTGGDFKMPTYIIDGCGTTEVSSIDFKLFSSGGQATPIGTSEGGSFIAQLGYLYTLETEGNVPNLTSIYRIWINNIAFTSGDVLPPNPGWSNPVLIEVTNANPVPTVVMLVGETNVVLTEHSPPSPPPMNGARSYWTGTFDTPNSPPTTHYLTFYTSDEVMNEGIVTLEARVIPGSVQVVDRPLNYPNPFRPLSGGPDAITKIQYMLSDNASITIIIYDITGQEVRRGTYSTGSQGGRAGINTVEWNGKSMFKEVVGNGMYIYKIVSGGKVIGTGKIVIVD